MQLIYQRFNNDCVISTVAMMLGLSYDDVFFPQVEAGFVPDNDTGLNVIDVMRRIGYEAEWCEGGDRLMQDDPIIVLVDSHIEPGEFHAVFVLKGVIYDPNPFGCSYDFEYVNAHAYLTYYNPTALGTRQL